MAQRTLSEIMAAASKRERRLALVDADGVVRQITHIVGPAVSLPEIGVPSDPTHSLEELDEPTYRTLRDDADSDAPRGHLFDRVQRKFRRRPVWEPTGLPPPTRMVGALELWRFTAPASVTFTWSGLPSLNVRVNQEEHEIDSPFTLEMNAPGQYELEVIDPRVAPAFYRFVVTKVGAQQGG